MGDLFQAIVINYKKTIKMILALLALMTFTTWVCEVCVLSILQRYVPSVSEFSEEDDHKSPIIARYIEVIEVKNVIQGHTVLNGSNKTLAHICV